MEGITCCSRRTAIAGTGSAASITCSSVARLRCQKHAEGPRGALLGLKPTKLFTARQTAPENPNKGGVCHAHAAQRPSANASRSYFQLAAALDVSQRGAIREKLLSRAIEQ